MIQRREREMTPTMWNRGKKEKVTKNVVWSMSFIIPYIFLPCDKYLKTGWIKDLPVWTWMGAQSLQSCPTLLTVAQAPLSMGFSRQSAQPRDRTQFSCIAGGFFTSWVTREMGPLWEEEIWTQRDTRDAWAQRKGHVRTQRGSGHWQAKERGLRKKPALMTPFS